MPTAKRQVKDVVFDILKTVAMKSSITWDVTLCSPEKVNRSFGETYRFHHQNLKASKPETSI
jgi:hypothetical protein